MGGLKTPIIKFFTNGLISDLRHIATVSQNTAIQLPWVPAIPINFNRMISKLRTVNMILEYTKIPAKMFTDAWSATTDLFLNSTLYQPLIVIIWESVSVLRFVKTPLISTMVTRTSANCSVVTDVQNQKMWLLWHFTLKKMFKQIQN